MAVFKISSDGNQVEEFSGDEGSREDLRTIFLNHGLRFIEENLRLVDDNVSAGRGFVDILAVDRSRRPVIIDYKVDEEASPDVLVQSLSRANYLQKNRKNFAGQISRKVGNIRAEELN